MNRTKCGMTSYVNRMSIVFDFVIYVLSEQHQNSLCAAQTLCALWSVVRSSVPLPARAAVTRR
jgi:hypothetical protein